MTGLHLRPRYSQNWTARVWFVLLLASITLEGLGRKFVPGVSALAWYFAKDAVLIAGLLRFGIGRDELTLARRLFSGFGVFLMAAALWTVLELANPSQGSAILGVIGLRAYWLWWIAPFVVARAIRSQEDLVFAVRTLAVLAIGIAAVAAAQFQAPADAAINQYAWGSESMGIATLGSSGRVRVSSTFAYLSGYSDFIILAFPLLLALGLGEGRGVGRWLSLSAATALAATVPMSGARTVVVLVLLTGAITVWEMGLLRTRGGRAALLGVSVIVAAGMLASPDAVEGVTDRFEGHDTESRFQGVIEYLPPVALVVNEYPLLGLGTGMQQNARFAFGIDSRLSPEGETGRYLVELGVIGYLLIWIVRFGILIALLRGARAAKLLGDRPLTALCLSLSLVTFLGNLTFDHVWQALYFVALGIALRKLLIVESAIPSAPVESFVSKAHAERAQ